MLEDLTYDAKIAVIKVLTEILHADNIIHVNEVKYRDDVAKSFSLNDTCMTEVGKLMITEALSTIKGLSIEQKSEIAKMMGKMIIIDEDINYKEVKLYNAYCESFGIEKEFNIEDYPEFSISDPFVNPEDLMNGI